MKIVNKIFNIGLLSVFLLIFIIIIKISNIEYQDNDDYAFSAIVSGSYSGTPSPMTVFEGYYFSSFVAWLYKFLGQSIEWYAVVFHFLYLFSFSVITILVLRTNLRKTFKFLVICGVAALQLYLIMSPQWTILAGELALASGALLIGRPNKYQYALSILLFLIASQIRFDSVMMIYILMSPILFFPIQLKKKSYWIKPITLIFTLIFSWGINKIGNRVYNSSSDWQYYTEYNKYRGIIQDHIARHDADILFTDSLKKNEYSLLCDCSLVDGKILNIEDLTKCVDYISTKKHDIFKSNLNPYYKGLKYHGFIIVSFWYSLLFFVAFKKKKYHESLIIMTTGILFVAVIAYCMNESRMKERLAINMIIPLILTASIMTYRIFQNSRSILYLALLLSIFFVQKYCQLSYYWEKTCEQREMQMCEINDLLSVRELHKLHFSSIERYCDMYHSSKTPINAKYIGKGWLNNIPLHKQYYSGYKSLVNGVCILKRKNEDANLDKVTYTLENYYHMNINIKKIIESEHYEIVQIVRL